MEKRRIQCGIIGDAFVGKTTFAQTLRKENIRIDETFFLGGLSKGKFLKGFSADIFFDDLTENCIEATSHVSTGHVPYGINNPK